MALKTFNVDKEIYAEFSKHCKREGISMSKQVEKFLIQEIEKIKAKSEQVPGKREIKKMEDKVLEDNKIHEHSFMKYC